jgi:hypothetical protein
MSSDNARIGFVGWIVLVLVAIPALAQSGAIEGIVVDAVTKAPIAGAAVKLYSGDKAVQSAGSDAQGTFRIAGVPDGSIEWPSLIPTICHWLGITLLHGHL